MGATPQQSKTEGRKVAIVIAATGVFWVLATLAGSEWNWSQRTRALFDLIAFAGFAWGLIVAYRLWRARQTNEG